MVPQRINVDPVILVHVQKVNHSLDQVFERVIAQVVSVLGLLVEVFVAIGQLADGNHVVIGDNIVVVLVGPTQPVEPMIGFLARPEIVHVLEVDHLNGQVGIDELIVREAVVIEERVGLRSAGLAHSFPADDFTLSVNIIWFNNGIDV